MIVAFRCRMAGLGAREAQLHSTPVHRALIGLNRPALPASSLEPRARAPSPSRARRAPRPSRRGCRSRSSAGLITSFGNMQPSQQMCWNLRVTLAVLVAQPEAGVLDDVELAVGIERQAVAAGLVVRAGAVDGARRSGRRGSRSSTGAARRSSCAARRPASCCPPVEVLGQDAVVRRVVAHREEQRVRHVGLEADGLRAVRPARAARRCASRSACRPSRSRLRRRAARRRPRRRRRPRGTFRRSSSCCRRDPWPSPPGWPPSRCGRRRTCGCRVAFSVCAIAQALRTCVTNVLRSSSLPMAEPPPVGGQTGATSEPTTRWRRPMLSASFLRSSSRRIDADVRIEEEQIDAVELDAVDLGLGGEVEHRVEIDRRLGAGSAFADEPGPHRVMDGGVFVHGCLLLSVSSILSGSGC